MVRGWGRRPAARAPRAREDRDLSWFVDSHCHLDRFENPSAVVAAAAHARVVTVAVTETPSAFQLLSAQLPTYAHVRLALGFHPLKVGGNIAREMALLGRLAHRTEYVGEVGLDFSPRGRNTASLQRDAFEQILAQPGLASKVFSVHSRGAEEQTIGLLASAGVQGMLHWYSGPIRPIDRALAAGLYFSANLPMMRSASGLRRLRAVPRDRIITETDGPYTRIKGRPTQPSDVPELVAELGMLWGLSADEARDQVFANMTRLYLTAKSRKVANSPATRAAN